MIDPEHRDSLAYAALFAVCIIAFAAAVWRASHD